MPRVVHAANHRRASEIAMTHLKATRIVLAISMFAAALTAATGAQPAPVTGAWSFTLQSDQGNGTPSAMFDQRGTALTGRFSSAIFGEADLKGTVNGATIAFTVFAQWQGAAEEMTFKGDYDGKGSIKGTYSNTFGHGTFTAARK